MKVYIPTYKRPGAVMTRRTLGGEGVLVCHEFEAPDYEQLEGGEIMVLPDSLRGNIAKVRNFILDHTDDDQIVMLDDDISRIGYYERGRLVALKPGEIFAFLHMGYQMADDLGANLWGVNLQADPKFYREYSPFSFLAPVLGTFSCHTRTDLRYDEDLFLNEDYDFFLKTIARDRVVLRFNKFHYLAAHLDKHGGCAAYRRLDEEKRQAEIMVRRWGPDVVRYDFEKSTNPRVRVPLPGI